MKLIKTVLGLVILAALVNSCSKEFSVENNGLKLPVGNWEFTADTTTAYIGNMDSAYIISSTSIKELHLNGTSANGDQNFRMTLYADTFKVGSYKASLFQSTFAYTAPAKTLYEAEQLVGEFIVNITSFSSNLVIGTFSGTAKDSANKLAKITEGKFKATLNDGLPTAVSSGVLGDSAGNCKAAVLKGTYTQGISAKDTNTVQLQVVVAEVGTYSISTNTVSGLTFAGSGIFTTTGSQNVVLAATGIPELAGEQTFTVRYGNSQCAFKINILPGAAPSGDYFPLSVNTNWTFGEEGNTSGDSVHRKLIAYEPSLGGNSYNTITEAEDANAEADDSTYFRKDAGSYYQYVDFAELLHFDNPAKQDWIFLKDNVAINSTWQTNNISGTIGGAPFSGYIKMTLLALGEAVTIDKFDFPDVAKVKYEVFLTGVPTPIQTGERWFAKNVGEVKTVISDGTNTSTFIVGSYKIF